MQENIDFVKALEIWASGESIGNYYINGIKIIWIGRAGKFIAFISALTIIIDIIGVERARKFGEYAQRLISARFFLTVIPSYLKRRYERLNSWVKNELFTLKTTSIWGWEDTFYGAFSGIISGYSLNWLPYSLFGNAPVAIILTLVTTSLLFIILFLASPAMLGVILILPALVVLLTDTLIEVIAFFLVQDQRIRMVALFFLVSGFLLDFLAS